MTLPPPNPDGIEVRFHGRPQSFTSIASQEFAAISDAEILEQGGKAILNTKPTTLLETYHAAGWVIPHGSSDHGMVCE